MLLQTVAKTSFSHTWARDWLRNLCGCCAPKSGRVRAKQSSLAFPGDFWGAEMAPDRRAAGKGTAQARLVVVGADGYRLHEELFTAGGRLGGRAGFARLNVGEVKAALAARGDALIPRHQQDEIAEAWPRLRDTVFAAVLARAGELRNGVMRLLDDRANTEIASLQQVMGELADASPASSTNPTTIVLNS